VVMANPVDAAIMVPGSVTRLAQISPG
jgi:hypothetical protein